MYADNGLIITNTPSGFSTPHTPLIPLIPLIPLTLTPSNPYPLSRGRGLGGKGRGTEKIPQGYPCYSLLEVRIIIHSIAMSNRTRICQAFLCCEQVKQTL